MQEIISQTAHFHLYIYSHKQSFAFSANAYKSFFLNLMWVQSNVAETVGGPKCVCVNYPMEN